MTEQSSTERERAIYALTHDSDGEDTGDLRVPCSRWGTTSAECAEVAYDLDTLLVELGCDPSTPESLEHAMSLVVNDHDDVASVFREHGSAELRERYAEQLGTHARYLDADAARAADWVYLPETDGEHSILTGVEYDPEVDGPAELITLVFNLEGYRGHYLTADFLSSAADLLEACRLDSGRFHLDDPANFPLRDRVDAMVHEANEAWARYHAHNDVVGADPDQLADYGDDCPEDCPCQWISEVADDMESVLSDLGFLVDWNDGVYVFALS